MRKIFLLVALMALFGVQLTHAAEYSPLAAWDPSMPLPNRVLTAAELAAWNEHYCNHGHISEIEREILRLSNLERAAYGLPPLAFGHTGMLRTKITAPAREALY